MTRILIIAIAALSSIHSGHTTANSFENHVTSSSANTPKGKFECLEDKSNKEQYVLRMAGKTIFRGSFMWGTRLGGTLNEGIRNENTGCPWIVASSGGYVIFLRDVQPPHYGIQGYAVIDFNNSDFTVTELAESQRPRDEKIPTAERIKWGSNGFTLTYFGYPIDRPGGSADSPKPRRHAVRYDFKSNEVSQKR